MASNESIIRSYMPAIEARFLERGRDYDDAHELLGAKGQFSDINRKFWKLYRSVWLGYELVGEQPDEIAEDIIGHCLLLIHLLHATPDGDDGPQDAFDDDCDDSEWDEVRHLRDRNSGIEKKLKDRTARIIELERELSALAKQLPRRSSAPLRGRSDPIRVRTPERGGPPTSGPYDRPDHIHDPEHFCGSNCPAHRSGESRSDDAKLQAVHVYEMIDHSLDRLTPTMERTAIWQGICDAFNIDRTEPPHAS